MGYSVWRLATRGLFHSGLALLSQAAWLVCADSRIPTSQRLVEAGVPAASAFEEQTGPGLAKQYSWRSRSIAAKLDLGGSISMRFPNGRDLRVTFAGADPGVEPQGESASYPVSYYLGSPKSWQSSIRWERVRYREIYPDIDLVMVSNAGQLEYNFEIRPAADPSRIRIRYPGAAVRLNRERDLVIRIGRQHVEQHSPSAFQSDGVDNRPVQCSYHVKNGEITLRLGFYDSRRALTVDPVLSFSTYLGGPGYDSINAVATDSAGNVYVAGETSSSSILPGGGPSLRTSRDVWVAKLNNAGTLIDYLAYLGGSGNDSGKGIAVDPSGNAYVTGITSSTDFPTTSGTFSTHSAGPQEAFVAKFGAGGQLQYSTYLGGGSDSGFAIAVDSTGAAYVAGQTASFSFPATTGSVQPSNHGGISDCFVSKLSAGGNSLVYSTFLGGSALDLCTGIAIDGSGDAYVTGTTYSANFPTRAPFQSSLQGFANAFVAELNPAGSALLYSTYLGGSGVDNGNAIAIDSPGSIYVTGCTSSFDFPATSGALQTALNGTFNAFVSKISPGGTGLDYSTFLGGSGVDSAEAIAVNDAGQAVVGGYTTSPNFPTANAIQPVFQGVMDAFAAVVSPNGSGLVYSSYFGGTGDDRGFAIASLPDYSLALGGMTASTNLPTAGALQTSFGGTYDGFVMKLAYMATSGVLVPLYRAYSPETDEHLYTIDPNEYAYLGAHGWSQEGIVAHIYNGPQTVSGVDAIPFYRFFNTVTLQHLWTADPNEYAVLRGISIWTYEEVAGYVFAQPVAGAIPFYRLRGGAVYHIWTTSANEFQVLQNQGWISEGIAAYVFP